MLAAILSQMEMFFMTENSLIYALINLDISNMRKLDLSLTQTDVRSW